MAISSSWNFTRNAALVGFTVIVFVLMLWCVYSASSAVDNNVSLGPLMSMEKMASMMGVKRKSKSEMIDQIYIIPGFANSFMKIIMSNTKLRAYHNTSAPAFFYGLLTDEAFNALKNHKGYGVIIFTGGDANFKRNKMRVRRIFDLMRLNPKRLFAVAISDFIAETLKEQNLPFLKTAFFPLDFHAFKPVKKGDGVFVYGLPHSVYHNDILLKYVQPKFPNVTFYYSAHMGSKTLNEALPAPFKHYEREELIKRIFPSCFLGIRLTHHDGLAGVVQELGLMGIKSVWNGGSPSAIPWKNLKDIFRAIQQEQKTIGTIDAETANKVKEFLTLDPEFYELDHYLQRLTENQ